MPVYSTRHLGFTLSGVTVLTFDLTERPVLRLSSGTKTIHSVEARWSVSDDQIRRGRWGYDTFTWRGFNLLKSGMAGAEWQGTWVSGKDDESDAKIREIKQRLSARSQVDQANLLADLGGHTGPFEDIEFGEEI